jgi:arginase
LKDCDIIYVSFDVDSMDPDLVSYGTGTPVKGGFSPDEIKSLLTVILQEPKVKCFEIVEINPCLDNKCNTMAETALDILEHSMEVLEQRPD